MAATHGAAPENHDPDGATSTSDLAGLQAMIERAGGQSGSNPPVERWNPEFGGRIDMEIRRDGRWYYQGTPIERMELVRLFASVLRKDEDGTICLVTPVERYAISVEDAPFLAVEMHHAWRDGEPVLTFRTNTGDIVEAGTEHPLRFETDSGNEGLKPYLLVRGRLEALLTRQVAQELVSHGEELQLDGADVFALRSAGAVFPIIAAGELARLSASG